LLLSRPDAVTCCRQLFAFPCGPRTSDHALYRRDGNCREFAGQRAKRKARTIVDLVCRQSVASQMTTVCLAALMVQDMFGRIERKFDPMPAARITKPAP
jgi:hypothetical protein